MKQLELCTKIAITFITIPWIPSHKTPYATSSPAEVDMGRSMCLSLNNAALLSITRIRAQTKLKTDT